MIFTIFVFRMRRVLFMHFILFRRNDTAKILAIRCVIMFFFIVFEISTGRAVLEMFIRERYFGMLFL